MFGAMGSINFINRLDSLICNLANPRCCSRDCQIGYQLTRSFTNVWPILPASPCRAKICLWVDWWWHQPNLWCSKLHPQYFTKYKHHILHKWWHHLWCSSYYLLLFLNSFLNSFIFESKTKPPMYKDRNIVERARMANIILWM